jgi:hypothetical protein
LFSWLRQNWEVFSWVLFWLLCFSFPGFARIGRYFLVVLAPPGLALFPCCPGFARIGHYVLVVLASPGLAISSLISWLRQDWALVACFPGYARIGRYFLDFLASPGLGIVSLLSWLRQDWASFP